MYNGGMNKFGAEYHREYYKKRRQAIIDYLGGRCVVCGTTQDLQVDHKDPSDKSFNISKKMSVKNNKAELDKCQLLCATHHYEKTSEENSGYTHGTIYGWMRMKCDCSECYEAKKIWHAERNAKRRKGAGYGQRL